MSGSEPAAESLLCSLQLCLSAEDIAILGSAHTAIKEIKNHSTIGVTIRFQWLTRENMGLVDTSLNIFNLKMERDGWEISHQLAYKHEHLNDKPTCNHELLN